MIGRLNHVAIAVPDLEAAADQYRSALGANVGAPQGELLYLPKLFCLEVLRLAVPFFCRFTTGSYSLFR